MATFVKAVSGPADTESVTFGSSVAAGNTVLYAVSWDTSTGRTLTSVQDNAGNAYSLVALCHDTTSVQDLAVYIARNVLPGSLALTVTWSGTAPSFKAAQAVEYDGIDGYVVDQVSTTVHGTATTGANGASGPTITPSVNNETVFAVLEMHAGGNTIAAGTGFTEDTPEVSVTTNPAVGFERVDQTTAAAVTAKWTVTAAGSFNAVIFSLMPAAAVVPSLVMAPLTH